MSKSIKLENETYIDSSSISHNKKTLKEILDASNVYSANEVVVGKWIDGKPLYRKMVDFGSLPSNNVIDKAHNIANTEHIHVNLAGTLWCTNNQSYTDQGQIFSPVFSEFVSGIYVNNTHMSVRTITPDANAFKMLMCLEYTKIID